MPFWFVYKLKPLLFSGSQGKWSWSCNDGSTEDETLNPSESIALATGFFFFFFSSSTDGDEEDDNDLWPPKAPMQNSRSLSEVEVNEAEELLLIFEGFSTKENCLLVLSPKHNASSISYEESKSLREKEREI